MIKRLAVALSTLVALTSAAANVVSTTTVVSEVYPIEKKYLSMEGPRGSQTVYLGDPITPELVWLTAIRTEVVGEDGKTPAAPELMCHMNVDLDTMRHQALFGLKRSVAPRLITLSQGMMTKPGVFEARVPDGFAFPLSSSEPLTVFTQVLNHNIENPKNLRVRHRVTFEYYRDRDLTTPLKPLFNFAATGMVFLKDPLAVPSPADAIATNTSEHGASCLIMPRAPNAGSMSADYTDPKGRKLTGHWVVPPGKQVNHTDVTWFMDLPYDLTIHYTAVHLHPYATKLTLRDVTTDETLLEATAKSATKGVGLEHVDSYASAKGYRVYKDHQYELISVYDNPTQKNSDSMAVMLFGAEDPEFVKPDAKTLAVRAIDYLDRVTPLYAAIRTNAGDFGIELLWNQAPQTARRFVRLARSGAFAHSKAVSVNAGTVRWAFAPLSEIQKMFATPIVLEPSKHEIGSLSMCPNQDGFVLVTGNPAANDGHCTAFARIGPGIGVIQAILDSPRDAKIEVKSIEIFDTPSMAATVKLDPPKAVSGM